MSASRGWRRRDPGAHAWSRGWRLIRTADDDALFRVNPFAFANQWDLDANEAIDLFLHATAAGLFEMDWL